MSTNKENSLGFPPVYVPNKVKDSEEYGIQMFKAILNATASYREERKKQISHSRKYARGKQSLQQYLDELQIEGSKQYVNISYTPTKVLQKFEKIVVDDYQQMEETPKAIGRAYHIQERKERRKSDLKFRMEYKDYIEELSNAVGFMVEDPNQQVPKDEEELDLITSLNSEEREELLLVEMIKKVFKDNDLDTKKRQFLSDVFQVHFGGYRHWVDRTGKIRIDFIPAEDALYSTSALEDFSDISYAGSACTMTIGEIRDRFNIPEDKEHLLYKLAYHFRTNYGNYSLLSDGFNQDWRNSSNRPYDDFTVPVYHIWKKTVKNVGYLEGQDSYGKNVFDIDFDITKEEYKSNNKKRTGVVYPETSYEGWFAGDVKCPVLLEWGESYNQTREGKDKEKVLCPYVFFMPDNRGTMLEESAVEKVIPEIQTMDLAMLKIKMTIANHPPTGYAIDVAALMDIDLGQGTMTPLDIQDIYQQTGKLYIKTQRDDGMVDKSLPIQPINVSIQDTINTYLLVYNNALNNIRDTLGINPNREGTAIINRASTQAIQTQIAISQTATYYIYRAYLKATQTLTKHIGIRILDVLRYGNPNKGYLKYLGEENIDFIKERKDIVASNYDFEFNPQMTKDDKELLNNLVMSAVSSRELSMPDALLILKLKDFDIAEKYMRYLFKKNREQAQLEAQQTQRLQAEAQGDMAVRVEEAKRETFQIQSALQAQEWKIKGENSTEVAILDMAKEVLKARLEGKQVPQEYLELERLVLDNAITKQEKSLSETEQQIEDELVQQEQEAVIQQVSQAVENGTISEEDAMMQLQQMGLA